jgi:hypothetical protein
MVRRMVHVNDQPAADCGYVVSRLLLGVSHTWPNSASPGVLIILGSASVNVRDIFAPVRELWRESR